VNVSFTVHGKPEPAGSKRGFQRGGRTVIVDANKNSRPWKALVTDAAIQAMGPAGRKPPLEGPLSVVITFWVARPKGHYGAKGLRPSAPASPTTRPDLLKLARGIEDAMTGTVYRDDSQIVKELLEKRYGDRPLVEVTVRTIAAVAAGDGNT
jgi:Holliday junction resolvase RusA-like endonuclease